MLEAKPSPSELDDETKAKKSARKTILIFALIFIGAPIFSFLKEGRPLPPLSRLTWQKIPCEILSADVERTGSDSWYPYEPKIKYRYAVNGTTLESESVGEARKGLYDDAEVIVQEALRNTNNYCYVGGEPRQSVLFRFSRDHKFDLLLHSPIAFGLSLLVLGVLVRSIEGLRILRSLAFGFLFLLVTCVGFGMSAIAIRDVWRTNRASTWSQLPCRIMFSTLQVLREDGKTTYRPDILYQYDSNGQTFTSSQIDFLQEATSGRPNREFLTRFPSEAEAVCYVNRKNPAQSVLITEWSKSHLALIPIGLFVGGLGLGLLWFFFWPRKIKPQQFTPEANETVLKSVGSQFHSIIWIFLFVGINIAIPAQFLAQQPGRISLNSRQWLILIGLNLFFLVISWRHLKPLVLSKPVLRLPQNHLVPGQPTTISWNLPGNTKTFELTLLCFEFKSSTEEFKEIHNQVIFSTTGRSEVCSAPIRLPETAPKTLLEKDHSVDWGFKARINAGTWRSLETLYRIEVL